MHQKRFCLAFMALSYSGNLFDDIGFIGHTAAATVILEGTYVFSPDKDQATRLLLEEAAVTYAQRPPEVVATHVTVEDSSIIGDKPMRGYLPHILDSTLATTKLHPLILTCPHFTRLS